MTEITLHFYGETGEYVSSRLVVLGELIIMPTNATQVKVFAVTTREKV